MNPKTRYLKRHMFPMANVNEPLETYVTMAKKSYKAIEVKSI